MSDSIDLLIAEMRHCAENFADRLTYSGFKRQLEIYADRLASLRQVPEGYVLLPRRLTAENCAKGLLSGEFHETTRHTCASCDGDGYIDDVQCEECEGECSVEVKVPVPWDTIKQIHRTVVDNLAVEANPAPPTSGVDLFRTARKVVRLVENDHWHDDARDALWCEIDNEILSAAYEIEEYRAARAASMPSVDSVIAEVDGLLETQGRLQFAQDNYNEEEAADFGVRLLDFMRRHGVAVRLALFQWSHGEPASLKRDGEDRAPTRPEASLKRPDNPAGSAISANNLAANAACNHLARIGYVWDGEAWATKATPAQAGAEFPQLSVLERQALQGILSNAEHDAGDTDDLAPSIEDDEDAYWAWHAYHGLTKLLARRGGSDG